MFAQWSLDLKELAERAVFQQPATYFTKAALQEHWRVLDFSQPEAQTTSTCSWSYSISRQASWSAAEWCNKNNLTQFPFPSRTAGPTQSFFVWCGSGPVLCCFRCFSLLAKRKSGREICVSSLLPGFFLFVGFSMVCLVCEAKGFHTFCTLFYRFSHCQDRASGRDRPQQREKKIWKYENTAC